MIKITCGSSTYGGGSFKENSAIVGIKSAIIGPVAPDVKQIIGGHVEYGTGLDGKVSNCQVLVVGGSKLTT